MLQSWITQIGAVAVLVVCLYALIAGSWRERFGALIYLTAYLLSLGFGFVSDDHRTWYLLIADALCVFGFYMLCWHARHPWPQWALFGQLVCVVAELATLINVGIGSRTFLTIETAAGWSVLLALLLGTVATTQTRRDNKKLAIRK